MWEGPIRAGALLVDIRSELQRATDGVVAGAIFHPRNVLEWRCDPTSGHDGPPAEPRPRTAHHSHVQRGLQSSLAASSLQDLGFLRATDLVGGFQAWAAAGLPVGHAPP